MTEEGLRGSALRVQQALEEKGLPLVAKPFPAGTRTAEDAAAAIGCQVAQIAKSVIFRAASSDRPVLVIAAGHNRVDEKKIAALLGEGIKRADAAFVRDKTGFAIGGVAPVGHLVEPVTYLDRDLESHGEIWAAAGTPNTVFRLTPGQLQSLTGADFVAVAG